jgi:hypothetical protein
MYVSLARALEDLHTQIAQSVLQLDDQALRWRPHPVIPSVHDLVAQAAALERSWIAVGVAGMPTRVEDADLPGGLPALPDHSLYQLGYAGQISQTILSSLSPAEWGAERTVAGRDITVAGCVLSTLEELARTLGQVQLIAQLWTAAHMKETA